MRDGAGIAVAFASARKGLAAGGCVALIGQQARSGHARSAVMPGLGIPGEPDRRDVPVGEANEWLRDARCSALDSYPDAGSER
jgi:hypothetical protein